MPWEEASTMSLRSEFVRQAREEGANVSALCRAYGISRKTGYKWLGRYEQEGMEGLRDRTRRPEHSPSQTPEAVEQAILTLRQAHPAWGGRKLKRRLEDLGHSDVPVPSTITAILKRQGQISPEASAQRQPFSRFEMSQPNQLWQMDFKGHFQLGSGERCHPLTVLDDHARFLVGLQACPDETRETVQGHLTTFFRSQGLPDRMLMDNGAPWGDDPDTPFTALTVWLLRLGIKVSHGRPYHPQTQGKDERLHRTLDDELLDRCSFPDFPACQMGFDHFRVVYNSQRPHEALDLDTPASHYHPSSRPFPETLPPLRFPHGAAIRRVDATGRISFHNQRFRVSRAFKDLAVGLLPDEQDDGLVHVFFNDILVRTLDQR